MTLKPHINYRKILYIIFLFIVSCNKIEYKPVKLNQTPSLDSIIKDYNLGNFNECINKSIKYVEIYPKNDVGWQFLGGSYLAIGQDSLAEFCIQKSLSYNPLNVISLTNFGVLNDRKKRFILAAEYYNKALEINETLPEIYSNYMLNRIKVSDYKKAQFYGEQALKYGNNLFDMANLSFVCYKNGNYSLSDSLYNQLKLLGFREIESLGIAIGK